MLKQLLLSWPTFNLENVNLLTNPNINPKNGVVYWKNMYVQNKHKGKQNQNKVNETRTVENIKHEPILSWSFDFIYREFLQEN